MKKKIISVLMILSLFLLAACGGGSSTSTGSSSEGESAGTESSSGEKKTLRVSIGVNDQHPEYESAMKFKELVESQTDDFIVEVYHSGQIADDRSAIEMLQFGTLEITIPSTSPLVNFIPAYGVFDLPFTIPSAEVADKVLDGPFGEKMFSLLEEQSLVGLAWWENGFRNLTNDVRAVAKMEDLQGLKIRTMENEIHLDAWKALGANPTPMAFTELFTAMQQGTVDGQENPYPTIDLSQYAEVQQHVSSTNHVYTPFIFLFSKQIWDTLTPEQQEIIRNAAVEAGKHNRQRSREVAAESLERLKQSMTFTEITPEEHARFAEAVAPVIEKHADTIGKEYVDEYLAEIAKNQ
ncbi:TRAP transporter substrate-binding protein [Bacillus sp. Marseille-P3661]|uniref:TRAP transporter substrate-binding protein n=1 Tax=Bacillus sp. Marseille-P3661 TaxID=1936234 RepID=UPI000C8674BD|nr:TRAP transporter substrate-binding protein [Bacillus sp. Marseille-P3661]